VFNSIQVTNYWFTLHRALGPLYQQAQTSSPNIRGISDQDVTLTLISVDFLKFSPQFDLMLSYMQFSICHRTSFHYNVVVDNSSLYIKEF